MKYKIKVKCTQVLELELDESCYAMYKEKLTTEQIAELEKQNVLEDPTYFDTWDESTIDVEVDVEEIKDA